MKESSSPFFSIILATYNGHKYLLQQLNSILNQEFYSWELIIIDDFSSDDSFLIANNFKKQNKEKDIKLIRNTKNLGPNLTFINNLYKSSGEWIVFCDQDDIWFENKLKMLHKKIKESPNVFAVLHNSKYLINDDNRQIYGMNKKRIYNEQLVYINPPKFNFLNQLIRNKVVGCMSTFQKDFLLKHLYVKTPNFIFYDHWLSLILIFYKKIVFIPKPLMLYRRHPETFTLRKFDNLIEKIFKRLILIFYFLLNIYFHIKFKVKYKK